MCRNRKCFRPQAKKCLPTFPPLGNGVGQVLELDVDRRPPGQMGKGLPGLLRVLDHLPLSLSPGGGHLNPNGKRNVRSRRRSIADNNESCFHATAAMRGALLWLNRGSSWCSFPHFRGYWTRKLSWLAEDPRRAAAPLMGNKEDAKRVGSTFAF